MAQTLTNEPENSIDSLALHPHTPTHSPHTERTATAHSPHTASTDPDADFLGVRTIPHSHEHTPSTQNGVQPHAQPHTPRTLPHTLEQFYSSSEIAERYPDLGKDGKPLGESAVRTRWFDWLKKVAPEPLLKTSQGFTQLASDLFDEFAQQVKRQGLKPEKWVEDARRRYSQEWASSGVIEGELMPDEVGGTLALVQTNLETLTAQTAQKQENLLAFIKQARSARANLTEKDIQTAKERGRNRAIARFEVELQSELETEALLRQALEGEE